MVDIFSEANTRYAEHVLMGREPMLTGVKERVVRLSGPFSSELNQSEMRRSLLSTLTYY